MIKKKQLISHVEDAAEKERSKNFEEQDPYNVEVDDSIVNDFNIDGLPDKNSRSNLYSTGEVEIILDNNSIKANIIYTPSIFPEKNIVRYIGDYRVNYTAGRYKFTDGNNNVGSTKFLVGFVVLYQTQ
jgi:hypothetical protein